MVRAACSRNGVPDAAATEAFRQIASFADFGFCRSHAGALARLAYETMYLKGITQPRSPQGCSTTSRWASTQWRCWCGTRAAGASSSCRWTLT
ncbi:MAG: hypothetical protein WKH64_11425 [Chloroflexia bacterium]